MALASFKSTKPKKVRAGKTAQYIADLKYMGDEPDVKGKIVNDISLTRAFNWYNYMCSRVDAREYLEAYLKANKRNDDLKTLKRVPETWINLQAGWFARILSRGGILNEGYMAKLELRVKETLAKAPNKAEATEETKKLEPVKATIQDRVKDKVSEFIGEFDEAIDKSGWTLSMYDWLQQKQIPANQAKIVAEFFRSIAEEAALLISRKPDPDLKEGYSSYTSAQLKQRAAFYASILTDCDRHASNKKPVVRKKKVVTADKKLKSFKFQKESKEFKVVSINPEKLLGADELVTFNVRYKTLTQFVAADKSGLDVKGATILNYDEEKSKTYRIGRKTEEHIEIALRGGKRAFGKMIASLKTCKLQQRINENTILLKV
jgi:hypothetical protein